MSITAHETTAPEATPAPRFRIFCEERQVYWRPGSRGYTTNEAEAGTYSRQEAEEICSGGRKKRMIEVAPPVRPPAVIASGNSGEQFDSRAAELTTRLTKMAAAAATIAADTPRNQKTWAASGDLGLILCALDELEQTMGFRLFFAYGGGQ
jgi:hypothetical protein